ncbi:MAG: MATE family efflux transporter [Verrucomicrobiota bacterium]|nr:MATE family efflux transporter [Verrucomicrobiota bacterium]
MNRISPGISALLRASTPVILLNLTFVAMQATDAWMIGKLGNRQLAAITPPSMGIFVIISFGYAFLGIVTALVGQNFGGGKKKECGHYGWLGIYSALFIGLVSLLLWPCASLFELFGGSERGSLGNLQARYFKVSLLSVAPVLITNAIASFYFGVRRPLPILMASLLGLILNAFISYGLIFGAFYFPEWNFDGAAWGTVFAASVECLVLLALYTRSPANRELGTNSPPGSLHGMSRLWKVGLHSGIQGAVDVLSWGVLISSLIACYGEEALAAGTILMRCMQCTFLPAEGVATITVALVAQDIGQGKPNRALVHARNALRINAVFMITTGVLFFIFRHELIGIFTDDPKVATLAAGAMIFITLAQFFDAMNVTYLHALQGAGDTRWSSITNVTLSAVILGGGGFLAITLFKDQGPDLIWLLAFLYITMQGILFRIRWTSGRWRNINLGKP